MRNLKRALSLVMAMALIVGMMVVSASAASKDFTDADEIKHPEAVNTMVALNVISGKEDGSYFDPTGTLTRAEMAKIISYVMNGGVEPNIGTKVIPTYSDINNHWAEAYIEYCTSMGIINGDGAGNFNPGGTLTASQAAKMFLTAMGYNATVFGLVGNDWETNTNRYANEAGLYENLGNVSVSAPISRDDACQMAYNAIQAALMVRGWSQNQATGQITEGYELSRTGKTLLSERFGGQIFIGSFDGNHETGASGAREGEIQVTGYLTTDTIITTGSNQTHPRTAILPSDLDISNIGEEVKVIFKDGTSGRSGTPDRNDTIYGVFNTGATQVVTATLADIGNQKSSAARIVVDGINYDTTDTVGVVYNYETSAMSNKAADNGSSAGNSTLTTDLKKANGDTVKFVCDDNGKIYRAYVVNTKIAAITAINNEKVSMNNGVGTIDIADNSVYEGAARGDVVTVTTLYQGSATDEGAYTIVEKAEVVSGTVDSFKDAESVTVDGTVYKIYNGVNMLNSIPGQTVTTTFNVASNDAIGEDFDLYMVNGFVGAAVRTSESANNYSVVLDVRSGGVAGSAFNALELQVLNAEGETEIITVSDDSAVTTASGYAKGDIIVYTGDAGNAVVTIEGKGLASGSYDDSTKTFGRYVTAANCVLFAETTTGDVSNPSATGLKYRAYDIRSLDDFSSARTSYVLDSNDRVVAVFADLEKTPAGASSNTVYGIVSSYVGRVSVGDDRYYQYTVASNDETYTLNMPNTTTIAKGDLVHFEPVSDNVYTAADVTKVTSGAVYVKEYSEADGTLTYFTATSLDDNEYVGVSGTQTTRALDDECVIVYVDTDGDAAGADIGINPFDGVTGYKNAAIVLGSDNTTIVAIYVETSGEEDILPKVAGSISSGDSFSGAVPEGSFGTDFGNISVTLNGGATVSGATDIAGVVNISGGEVTMKNGGTLIALEITVEDDGVLTLENGCAFLPTIMHIESGAKINFPGNISFTASRAFDIDFSVGAIGDYTFDSEDGLAGALTAVQGYAGTPNYGYGSWTFGA